MPSNNRSANTTPSITVVMATYNGSPFVALAVNSILAQTFTDFEFIIIDDGSCDDTLNILSSYSDSRIRIISNDKNRGTSYSRNLGISQAKGRYIANMDQDDFSHPDRLQKLFTFMENNPGIGVCGTWAQTFGAKSRLIKRPSSNLEIKAYLFWRCAFVHPSTLLRVAVLHKLNLFYDEVVAEDYELWCRMAGLCDMANLPMPLLDYRIHAQQISTSKRESLRESTTQILKRNIEQLLGRPLIDRELSILRYKTKPSSITLPDIFDFFLTLKHENDLKMSYDPAYFDKMNYRVMKKIIRVSAPPGPIFSMTVRRYLYRLISSFGIVKTIGLFY